MPTIVISNSLLTAGLVTAQARLRNRVTGEEVVEWTTATETADYCYDAEPEVEQEFIDAGGSYLQDWREDESGDPVIYGEPYELHPTVEGLTTEQSAWLENIYNRLQEIEPGDSAILPIIAPNNPDMVVVAFFSGDFGSNKIGIKVTLEIEDAGDIWINDIFQVDKKQEQKTRLLTIDDVAYAVAPLEVFPSSVLVANGYSGVYVAKWDNGPREGRRIRVPDDGGRLKTLIDTGVS
jgi:hypothetical protein